MATAKKMPMARFSIKELGPPTWPDFARFFESHPPVWSGCWCTAFHLTRDEEKAMATAVQRRALKKKLVLADRSHAALVYDGADIVGWCQFGPPAELPARMSGYGRIGEALPDWRITCFVVHRDRRRQGIAKAALVGALRIIAAKGGGTVDGYPINVKGKPYSSSFLWSGTESMFAEVGFRSIGHFGTSKVVMRKVVRSR
jgi:GNAT superfamily N-acetyltransferase